MTVRLSRSKIYEKIDATIDETVEDVCLFVRQPSIVTNMEDLKASAQLVEEYLQSFGCSRVELISTSGAPIVFGEYDAHSDITLSVYLWYDTDKLLDGWSFPPLEGKVAELPSLGTCIIGRGAFTKGSLAAFVKAMSAIRNCGFELPVNLRFVIEGEENLLSPNLPNFVENHGDLVEGSQGVLFPRVAQERNGKVIIKLGGKGMLRLELTCSGASWGRGPRRADIHGSEKAWVDSPIWRLVHALTTMTESDGNTATIDGFYDNVKTPSNDDRELIDRLAKTFNEDARKKELDVETFVDGLHGKELLTRYLCSPTFNLTGIESGPGGFVVPHRATAKLEIRIVPEQSVNEILDKVKSHLAKRGYQDIKADLKAYIDWSRTNPKSPIVQSVAKTCDEFNVSYELWPNNVTSPPHGVFTTRLGIPFCDGGLGHGGRHHAPDEYLVIRGTGTVGDLALAEKSFVAIVDNFANEAKRNRQFPAS